MNLFRIVVLTFVGCMLLAAVMNPRGDLGDVVGIAIPMIVMVGFAYGIGWVFGRVPTEAEKRLVKRLLRR